MVYLIKFIWFEMYIKEPTVSYDHYLDAHDPLNQMFDSALCISCCIVYTNSSGVCWYIATELLLLFYCSKRYSNCTSKPRCK